MSRNLVIPERNVLLPHVCLTFSFYLVKGKPGLRLTSIPNRRLATLQAMQYHICLRVCGFLHGCRIQYRVWLCVQMNSTLVLQSKSKGGGGGGVW